LLLYLRFVVDMNFFWVVVKDNLLSFFLRLLLL